jgi:hypothetical protein
MTRLEIKQRLFNDYKNEFNPEDYFDQHGEVTQPFEFTCGYEYQDEDNGWHEAYMDVVGAIYMKESETEYENTLGYGGYQDVSDSNTIEDWEILSVSIYIDGKDITILEDSQIVKTLL